jgi:hypothetical protein
MHLPPSGLEAEPSGQTMPPQKPSGVSLRLGSFGLSLLSSGTNSQSQDNVSERKFPAPSEISSPTVVLQVYTRLSFLQDPRGHPHLGYSPPACLPSGHLNCWQLGCAKAGESGKTIKRDQRLEISRIKSNSDLKYFMANHIGIELI